MNTANLQGISDNCLDLGVPSKQMKIETIGYNEMPEQN